MKHFAFIDGNALGYMTHYATELHSPEGLPTQAVFGFINVLVDIKKFNPNATLVVLWDGKAKWRFEECPSYKQNRSSDDPVREKKRQDYKVQVPYIQKFLQAMGVKQLLCKTMEADDLAACLVAQKAEDQVITLYTCDRDWLQLVRKNVSWKDLRSSKIILTNNFAMETGFNTPEQLLDSRCLSGDKSDNIGGVGGIGEVGAKKLLEQFTTVRNFFDMCDSGAFVPKSATHKRLLGEGRSIYERNYKIMQLLHPAPIDKENLVPFKAEKNHDKFFELCGELGFSSMIQKRDEILSMF